MDTNPLQRGEIEPLLQADEDGELEAKSVFADLVRRPPDRFEDGQLRTLQRPVPRLAQHGPDKEVMSPQTHAPGRMASLDFTCATDLGVTIAGALFAHMFFHLAMPWSGWHFVDLAFSETFEALTRGLQNAMFSIGGVPQEVRMGNLSAVTHELKETGGRALTKRFRAVLDHFGLDSSRIRPGEAHENGAVGARPRRAEVGARSGPPSARQLRLPDGRGVPRVRRRGRRA